MKPAMRQVIILSVPQLDDKGKPLLDKYSRPIVSQIESRCRTRVHGEWLHTMQGSISNPRDEIDVPASLPIKEGQKVMYTTIQGEEKSGTVSTVTESTNLTASKVYFKTCVING